MHWPERMSLKGTSQDLIDSKNHRVREPLARGHVRDLRDGGLEPFELQILHLTEQVHQALVGGVAEALPDGLGLDGGSFV